MNFSLTGVPFEENRKKFPSDGGDNIDTYLLRGFLVKAKVVKSPLPSGSFNAYLFYDGRE
jgi:hypothetical protein